LCVAIGWAGLVASSGGVAFIALGIPPIAVGVGILQRVPFARTAGLILATVSAATLGFLASTPFRGLTPPAGSPPPDVDLASVVLAALFLLVALLLLVAKPTNRA
jgi:hypothetical protein